MLTSERIKDENWKNKTVKAEGKCEKLNPSLHTFMLRVNSFNIFIEGKFYTLINMCSENSLIHGLQHLEIKSKFLTSKSRSNPLFSCALHLLAEPDVSKTNNIMFDFITKHNLNTSSSGTNLDCWNSIGRVIDSLFDNNIRVFCSNCKAVKHIRYYIS